MRVYLGSDHAGFELKAALIDWLRSAGHEAVDCGPASYQPLDASTFAGCGSGVMASVLAARDQALAAANQE